MNWKFWQRDPDPEILRQFEVLQAEVATIKGVLRVVPHVEALTDRVEKIHNRITELQGIVAVQMERMVDWSERYDKRAPAIKKSVRRKRLTS